MTRFLATLVALGCFIGAGFASPGWMLVLILVGFVASFVAVLAFAAARIDASAQDEVYVPSPEEAEAMKRNAARNRPGPRPVPSAPPAARPAPTHDGTMAISAADLARQRKPPGSGGTPSS